MRYLARDRHDRLVSHDTHYYYVRTVKNRPQYTFEQVKRNLPFGKAGQLYGCVLLLTFCDDCEDFVTG